MEKNNFEQTAKKEPDVAKGNLGKRIIIGNGQEASEFVSQATIIGSKTSQEISFISVMNIVFFVLEMIGIILGIVSSTIQYEFLGFILGFFAGILGFFVALFIFKAVALAVENSQRLDAMCRRSKQQ